VGASLIRSIADGRFTLQDRFELPPDVTDASSSCALSKLPRGIDGSLETCGSCPARGGRPRGGIGGSPVRGALAGMGVAQIYKLALKLAPAVEQSGSLAEDDLGLTKRRAGAHSRVDDERKTMYFNWRARASRLCTRAGT
jgi:hypothetical protein